MSSERRLLLAVSISFLILLFYPFYLRWVSPPPSQTSVETGGVGAETNRFLGGAQEVGGAHAPETGRVLVTPQPAERETNLYEFSNERFDAQFSDRGAVMTKLQEKSWGKERDNGALLIDSNHAGSEAFFVSLPNQGVDFKDLTFSLESLDERSGEVRFSAEAPGKWRLRKNFRFDREGAFFWFEVTAENISDEIKLTTLEVTSDLSVDSTNRNDLYEAEALTALQDKLEVRKLDKLTKKPHLSEGSIAWHALKRKYFTIVMCPDAPAAFARSEATSSGKGSVMRTTLRFAPEELGPGEALTRKFLVYAGPQYYDDLKSFDRGFERMLSHGIFGAFKLWLLIALRWTHKVTGNYGWAIIIVTCVIKLLFTPFTHMSLESMRKMQALQPKIKALQEQYKSDHSKLSQETMALYKRHKANPFGGCLPMLLQIPVFISFYQVLVQTVELKGEPFVFWIKDLSAPDRAWALPFSLPFLGDAVNILPLLAVGSTIWQQRLSPQVGGDPAQQKMMMLMPVFFGFIFYGFPAGFNLYFLVSNLLSIFHQLFVKGKAPSHHEAA